MEILIPEKDRIPYLTGEIKSYYVWPNGPYYEVQNQPERSKREDPEKGCGALNTVVT